MENRLKLPYLYALVTVLIGLFPFGLYGVERSLGSLPSEETWYGTGINHGPWRGRFEGLALYYPIVFLIIATSGIFLSRGVKDKKRSLLAFGLLLIVIQVAVTLAQMYFLAWTVD
jgi:hypothetical protein